MEILPAHGIDPVSLIKRSSGSGGVSTVTATAPVTSSGGSTPNISTSMATGKLLGRTTAGSGVAEEITPSAEIGLSAGGIKINRPDPIAYTYWGA